MSTFAEEKDPDAVLDYSVDWGKKWMADGDSLLSSQWIISGADNSLVVDSSDITGNITTVWLSGGLAGYKYTVTNRIISLEGRIDDRSVSFNIGNK